MNVHIVTVHYAKRYGKEIYSWRADGVLAREYGSIFNVYCYRGLQFTL